MLRKSVDFGVYIVDFSSNFTKLDMLRKVFGGVSKEMLHTLANIKILILIYDKSD